MAISTGAAIVGGSLATGLLGAKSASKASKAAAKGEAAGIAEQQRQFDITQESLRPSIEAGDLAREQQLALLGLSGKEAQQAAFAGLQESPGQKFIRERQQKSLVRGAAATGQRLGGNVLTALQEQGTGFAQQDIQNQFGRLGQLAGQGQSAATNVGQFGQQTAGAIQQGQSNIGQFRASGIQGRNQAIQQGFGGVLTGLAQGGQFSPAGIKPPVTGFPTSGLNFNMAGGSV